MVYRPLLQQTRKWERLRLVYFASKRPQSKGELTKENTEVMGQSIAREPKLDEATMVIGG